MILESIQFSNIYKIADLQAKLDSGYFDDFLVEFSIYLMTEKGLVKINQDKTIEYNVSVDLSNYVKFTDMATNDKAGVVLVDSSYGIKLSSTNKLSTILAGPTQIAERKNATVVIVPQNLNAAVKAALSDANRISDMTNEEKTNARRVIDAVGFKDIASTTKFGVVMINPAVGVKIFADGSLGIQPASEIEISSRGKDTKAIIPNTLNFAVKSALSDAKHLTMTADEQAVARSVLGALGSVDLTDYVKNTDYASRNTYGIVKTFTGSGVDINPNGEIVVVMATDAQITARTSKYASIVPANLDYAVRSVLPEVQTSLPETIIKNCIYDLGEQTNLSITLPTTGKLGDWLQFDFLSGLTKTTLEINAESGILGFDLIPESNYIYTMYLDWGMIGKNIDDSINYGWRFNYSEYPLNS